MKKWAGVLACVSVFVFLCYAFAAQKYVYHFRADAGGTVDGTYGVMTAGNRCYDMRGYITGWNFWDSGTTTVGVQMDILLVEEITSGVTRDVLIGKGGSVQDSSGDLVTSGVSQFHTPLTDESGYIYLDGNYCLEIHEAGAYGDGRVEIIIDDSIK